MKCKLRPIQGLRVALLFVLTCGFARPVDASVVYVNANAIGSVHDGTSWGTAFLTVQDGANAAGTGDEVWVASGTYPEHISLWANQSIYGGFAGSEAERGQRDWRANATILDGGGAGRVVSSKSVGPLLDGFILRNGDLGVYIYQDGEATISHCEICSNSEGVAQYGKRATITNCTIYGNAGTAIQGTSTVVNCTVVENGTGIAAWPVAMTIANSIVAFNGRGISAGLPRTSVVLSHNDVFGNTSGNYVGLSAPTGRLGNISLDPRLSDRYRDVHIQPGSPCVDAGDDSAAVLGETDIDGAPRITGAHVDIGSDESDGTTWTTRARIWYVASTGNDVSDGSSWANAKRTLAGGLAVARGSDEVWVASGEYAESPVIPAGVSVYGGFAGAESSTNNRNLAANATVLTGRGDAATTLATLTYRGVLLDGFTLRDAGQAIQLSAGDESVNHCVITDNARGISVNAGTSTISNCTISENEFEGITASVPTNIVNCTITENGTGIHIKGGARVAIVNSIAAFNGTGVSGDYGYTEPTLSHNDVYGNTTANFVGVAGPTDASGNISQDPRLSNPYHDIRIQPDSPCVGAGDDSAVPSGETDRDGKPRIIGAAVDIGSSESDGMLWEIPSVEWHVSPTGDDANDGKSWATAKRTVTGALLLAQGADEVWVAKGTYYERVRLSRGIGIYGGFAGSETSVGQRDYKANLTSLDGNGVTSAGVVTALVEGAIIDGFTVRDGADGVDVIAGAAKIANCAISGDSAGVSLSGGAATITNCTVTGNSDGVYIGVVSATMTDCVSTGNDAAIRWDGNGAIVNCTFSNSGCGVLVEQGSISIVGCKIVGNPLGIDVQRSGAATISGCAIRGSSLSAIHVWQDGTATVANCAIVGNSNGIYVYGGTASITDCTLCGNSSQGLYVWGIATAYNCTICDNTICGIFVATGTAAIANSIVAYNGSGIYLNDQDLDVSVSHTDAARNAYGDYSNLANPTGTNGNISADPLFVNRFTGDWHLRLRSPCIDTGDDTVVTPGETDLDGRPRIQRLHVDMGCYEFPGVVKYVPTKAAGAVAG